MASREATVAARLLLIGKDAMLAGYREITAANRKLIEDMRSGAAASRDMAAASSEEAAALGRLQAQMDLYKANLAEVNAETDAVATIGKRAFLGLTAAAVAWSYESIKWARQYQSALVQLRTQAGLTVKAMNEIGAASARNASGLGMSRTTYVKSAYWAASAGFAAKTTIAITNASSKLAGIGNASPETTVRAVTGIMRAYNFKGSQATHVAAVANAIVGAGAMHMGTLDAAAGTGIFSTARTYGLSAAQTGAAIAFLTDRSVPARQAATHLRMTMALLGAPSQISATIQRQLGLTTTMISAKAGLLRASGVTASQLAGAMRHGGFVPALRLLKEHMAGLTKTMVAAGLSRMFGGGRMGTTMLQLYNSITTLAAKTRHIAANSTKKSFNSDWAQYTRTFTFQMKRFEKTIENVGIAFGLKLLPPLTKVLEVLTSFFGMIGKHKGLVIGLATAVGAVLVPAIGLYLKRAFFEANGSIMTVVRGYKRLVLGQSEEQLALERTQAQLATTTMETKDLSAADRVLGATSVATSEEVGAEGAAAVAAGSRLAAFRSAMGAAAAMGGMMALATIVPQIPALVTTFKHPNGPKHLHGLMGYATDAATAIAKADRYFLYGPSKFRTTVKRKATIVPLTRWAAETHTAARGAARAVISAAVLGTPHAAVHVADNVRHSIASGAAHVWDDVFSPSSPTPAHAAPIHVHSHVYLTGKELKDAVVKHVKMTAARS